MANDSLQRHVQDIRHADIIELQGRFRPGMRVLEVGGGNGYQSKVIAEWGCEVSSIDIAPPSRHEPVFYPVQLYDGRLIPFSDHTFDVVYTSCVLEHIPQLVPLLREMRRVLKPGGSAIHIVPSATWRFWTSVAHYPYLLKRAAGVKPSNTGSGHFAATSAQVVPAMRKRLGRLIMSPAHGEYPDAISEIYYYSKSRWIRVFREAGFFVTGVTGNGLFHTGYRILPWLGVRERQWMANVLGSATHVFTVKPL